jgi:hypothetical protein
MTDTRTVRDAGLAGAALGATLVKEAGNIAGAAAKSWSNTWEAERRRNEEFIKTLPKNEQADARRKMNQDIAQGKWDSFVYLFAIGAVVYGLFKLFL